MLVASLVAGSDLSCGRDPPDLRVRTELLTGAVRSNEPRRADFSRQPVDQAGRHRVAGHDLDGVVTEISRPPDSRRGRACDLLKRPHAELRTDPANRFLEPRFQPIASSTPRRSGAA